MADNTENTNKKLLGGYVDPPDARDCYQLAKLWSIDIREVADEIFRRGWLFIGYSWDGNDLFVPPDSPNKDFV